MSQITPQPPRRCILESPPGRGMPAAVRMPAVVRVPACHSRRFKGGALSAVRVQCARSATIWASGRTRDPYFEILGAPRGIMVTPSGGFEF